jgi:16S rRNA (guanine966-N2)-methyltransferase
VRVIAGAAKGRRLETPRGRGTRPTADRVREALFSSLQRRLPGARVADLYAGSGALGIEALSRGAATATFVERSRTAYEAIRHNLEVTGLGEDAAVLVARAGPALRDGLPGGPFDIVLIDPPYDVDPHELAEVLELVADALAPGGIVVVEASRRAPAPRWPETLRAGRTRRYGDTVLHEAHPASAADGPEAER